MKTLVIEYISSTGQFARLRLPVEKHKVRLHHDIKISDNIFYTPTKIPGTGYIKIKGELRLTERTAKEILNAFLHSRCRRLADGVQVVRWYVNED